MGFEIRARVAYIAHYIIYINENFSAVTLALRKFTQEDDTGNVLSFNRKTTLSSLCLCLRNYHGL